MKKEELIKQLQELPEGTDICIYDYRKNLFNQSDEPNGIGIESDFSIEYHDKNVNTPFATITFENDDYNSDGTPNYGSSIMNIK